jgi:neutral trehalase
MSRQLREHNQKKIKHYSSISEFLREGDLARTEHPMFYIQKITNYEKEQKVTLECTSDFYIIFFKKLKGAEINYGRTKYDFENGTMLFSKPN